MEIKVNGQVIQPQTVEEMRQKDPEAWDQTIGKYLNFITEANKMALAEVITGLDQSENPYMYPPSIMSKGGNTFLLTYGKQNKDYVGRGLISNVVHISIFSIGDHSDSFQYHIQKGFHHVPFGEAPNQILNLYSEYLFYIQTYPNYGLHIEQIGQKDHGIEDIQTALLLLKAYIDEYRPRTDPKRINSAERARIRDFIQEKLQNNTLQPPASKELANYIMLPISNITNLTKVILNNPQRVSSIRRGQVAIQPSLISKDLIITYKASDGNTFTIELARTKELFATRVRNGAKIFNFILQKLNEQNGRELTTFQLQELVDNGIYKTKDTAYRGLKSITNIMMSYYIEGTQTIYEGKDKKQIRNAKAVLVSQRDISYTQCTVSLPPIIRNDAKYITILPIWAYTLPDQAYMLLDYIFYLARQNTKEIQEHGHFNIGLEAIRIHLGLPTPKEAKNDPKKLIFDKIEQAICDIEEARNGDKLKITPIYNPAYKNISEYLKGYIQVELDEEARSYMEKIAGRKDKERQKELKKKERARQRALEKQEQKRLEEQIPGQQEIPLI